MLSLEDMLDEIEGNLDWLTDWEKGFFYDMAERVDCGEELTPGQADKVCEIYEKVCE